MKYTIESFEEDFNISASEVVRFLGDLKENIPTKDFGICFNLSGIIHDEGLKGVRYDVGHSLIKKFSIGWKHHTGDKEYPVPSLNKEYNGLWKGKQLEYRLDLIDYIIEQLKEIK